MIKINKKLRFLILIILIAFILTSCSNSINDYNPSSKHNVLINVYSVEETDDLYPRVFKSDGDISSLNLDEHTEDRNIVETAEISIEGEEDYQNIEGGTYELKLREGRYTVNVSDTAGNYDDRSYTLVVDKDDIMENYFLERNYKRVEINSFVEGEDEELENIYYDIKEVDFEKYDNDVDIGDIFELKKGETYTLQAFDSEGLPIEDIEREFVLDDSKENIDIDVPTGSISGQIQAVFDETNFESHLEYVEVHYDNQKGIVELDNEFLLDNIPAGTRNITIKAPFGNFEQEVDIKAGETVTIDLTIDLMELADRYDRFFDLWHSRGLYSDGFGYNTDNIIKSIPVKENINVYVEYLSMNENEIEHFSEFHKNVFRDLNKVFDDLIYFNEVDEKNDDVDLIIRWGDTYDMLDLYSGLDENDLPRGLYGDNEIFLRYDNVNPSDDYWHTLIAHEIGHHLGFNHTSNDKNEEDDFFKNTLMWTNIYSPSFKLFLDNSVEKRIMQLNYSLPVDTINPFDDYGMK
ncbi:MAG: reprolysin-like metallopeptidase [Candidatus Woesearchaeota archaeon]